MVSVLKKDRSTELFSSTKVMRSCRRAGCTSLVARLVAANVRKRAYNRIRTSGIRRLVIAGIRKYDSRAATEFAKFKKRRH